MWSGISDLIHYGSRFYRAISGNVVTELGVGFKTE